MSTFIHTCIDIELQFGIHRYIVEWNDPIKPRRVVINEHYSSLIKNELKSDLGIHIEQLVVYDSSGKKDWFPFGTICNKNTAISCLSYLCKKDIDDNPIDRVNVQIVLTNEGDHCYALEISAVSI